MTHRTHTLRPGSQWRRPPSAPVSLRPRTVLLLIGGVALAGALVVGVVVSGDFLLKTTKLPVDMSRSIFAPRHMDAESPLADLAWLAGTWREEREGGGVLEERWDPPLGNSMTGTMRWLEDGRATMYEFLLIEAVDDDVRLNVRHFHPGSVAWEDKEAPLTLVRSEAGASAVTFASDHAFPRTYTMRLAVNGELDVALEGERNGEPTRMEFRYARVDR